MENKNIEIIGAGLSGLLLAYYIFKNTNKFNVTVYEKNSSIHKNKNFCFWLEKKIKNLNLVSLFQKTGIVGIFQHQMILLFINPIYSNMFY